MANMIIPFKSIEASVVNGIFYKIGWDVGNLIRIDEDAQIILYNSMEEGKTDVKDNAKLHTDNNLPVTVSKRRLSMTLREPYDEYTIGTDTIDRKDNYPIFLDKEVGVYLAPNYLFRDFEVEFTYTSPSKSEIDIMRDFIRMNLTRAMEVIEHDLEYTLIVPEQIDGFLKEVWERKNRLFPIEFKEYIETHATNRLHLITDMSNAHNIRPAIKERITRVIGTLDFTTEPPDRNTDNAKNQHTITFSYKVRMELPSAITAIFPVIICNELMPDSYLEIIEARYQRLQSYHIQKHTQLSVSNSQIAQFEEYNMLDRHRQPLYPLHLPIFDSDHIVGSIPGYGTIMSVLCIVDEDDRKTLLNLKELDPYELSENFFNYLKRVDPQKVTVLYNSLFFIGLEQKGRHFNNDILELDEDLNLRSKVELNLLDPVRISFNVCTDISFLNETSIKEMLKEDDLFMIFLVEYLEVKNQLGNSKEKRIEGRNNLLDSFLIRKVNHLLGRRKYDVIKDIILVLRTDPLASRSFADLMKEGFPLMLRDLVSREIFFIDGDGRPDVFSTDPVIKRDQKLGVDNPNYVRNYYPDHPRQLKERDRITLHLAKTQMNNALVILRGDT